MMVRNLILGFISLVLVGCAASPSSPVSTTDAKIQKRQASQAEPLTGEQQILMNTVRQAINDERWDVANEALKVLKTERPQVPEIHALMAMVARQQGDHHQAIEAYRTAFDLNPYDAVSANNLALLLREQGQFREAVAILQEGIDYSPDTANLHYNLAIISELYLLDLQLALNHYRKFRALNGQDDQLVAGWIADLERRLD